MGLNVQIDEATATNEDGEVAADNVVNGWLCEMQVGTMPAGLLHDPELKDLSAEEVNRRMAAMGAGA